jgi:5-methylcytosine-specific restriction endonuclease McrA
MAIGKSLRFEVFARDAFTCQYCGMRPPDVVLEVDHIHPRSKGGSDDPINLITSCFDCNRGKRAKVISEVVPRPDADLAFLKVEQEVAEVKRFLAAKKRRDKAVKQLCDVLRELWSERLTETVPSDRVLIPWINRYGPEEVEKAITIASASHQCGRFGRKDDTAFYNLMPFIGGILKKRDADRQEGIAQCAENLQVLCRRCNGRERDTHEVRQ